MQRMKQGRYAIGRILIGISAVLLCWLLPACRQKQEETVATGDGKAGCIGDSFKGEITLDTVRRMPVENDISLLGNIEANPDKVFPFVTLVEGVIDRTYFSLGDKVVKGQVLAGIRSPALSTLRSEKKTHEARIAVAERKLFSVQSMYEDGIASEKELIEAKSDLTIEKAELEKVNAILSLYSASSDDGVFQIKAPASGIITEKNITAGMQVTEGEPLFVLSDLGDVWAQINVYADNIGKVQPGMEVRIKTLSYPDEWFTGKIAAVSQVFDSEEKVLKARAVLSNRDMRLKPGMLLDATVTQKDTTQAEAIPVDAIIFDDNKDYVVVYKSDCDLEIRPVQVSGKNARFSYVSAGLRDQEQIVSKNQLLIYQQLRDAQRN